MKEKIEKAINELVAIEFKGNITLNVPAINTVLRTIDILADVLKDLEEEESVSDE